MTTWAAVPFVEVINHVVKFDICTDNGKIKSRGDPIWSEVYKTWKLPSGKYLKSPVALFFDFQQNRHQIYDRYVQERGLNFSQNSDNKCTISLEAGDTIDIPESKSKFIGFYINFTKEEWLKIKPVEKLDCNNKKYYILQSGWTDIISELIYISQKLPCAFKFPQQCVQYLNSENNIDKFIVKISGSCTEKACKAALLGECIFTFSEDENVKMLIHTQNTIDAPHSKKRPITGNKRREYAEALQLQKGDLFKRRLITKYQEYGEQAAPIIPNTPVITQIRHEGKKIRLNIQGNLWESLKSLKHNNVELQGVIKQVGFDKFFLMYWTHQQSDIYNDLMTLESIVSLDATGSVVRKISFLQNYDSGPIFLYQIVTYIGSLIVPVCQMLSERHDTKIVTFWLQEWISTNVKVPLEVVTDMSLALQNGLCLAFCQMSYKQYLSHCYQFLLGKSKVLTRPYVRIDIAHLIHSVATQKCFLSVKFVVKDFYLRAIGLMSTIEDLKDVVKMMKVLLNISQNEYGCKDDINWILTKMETFEFDETVDYKKIKISSSCDKKNDCDSHLTCHDEELEVDDSCESNSSDDSYLSDFIDKLVKETPNSINLDKSIKFDNVNPYFLTAIREKLITLFKQFPAWTNVMRKHYNSENNVATSARSENYFKYVKENVLEDRQPTCADMFLIQHLQTISPRVIEARAVYDKHQMVKKTSKDSKKNIERKECVLNFKENWRNKNKNEETEDINLTDNQNEFSDNSISMNNNVVIDKCKNSANESEMNQRESSEEDTPRLPSDSEMKSTSPVVERQLTPLVTSGDTSTKFSIDFTDSNASKENNNLLNNNLELIKPKFHSTPNTTCDSSTNLHLSFKQNKENNFSIILNESPIKFKINESKISVKREHLFHSTSCQPTKRGKYVNPFPEVKAFHENANKDLKKKNKKIKMVREWVLKKLVI